MAPNGNFFNKLVWITLYNRKLCFWSKFELFRFLSQSRDTCFAINSIKSKNFTSRQNINLQVEWLCFNLSMLKVNCKQFFGRIFVKETRRRITWKRLDYWKDRARQNPEKPGDVMLLLPIFIGWIFSNTILMYELMK